VTTGVAVHAASLAAGAGDRLAAVAAPELARAAARYAPQFGSMTAADVARGRALVHDALAGLQLVPVVNRWSRTGGAALEASGAFLGTVHTLPPRNAADRVMRFVRRHWEQARGFRGEGVLEGRTVFASGQFAPAGRNGTADAVAGLDAIAARRGSHGVARFGDEAMVLDPAVLERATISGKDSGTGIFPARVAPIERIDDVALERLGRSHGFRFEPFSSASRPSIGVDGPASAAARRGSLRRLLHDTPDDVAVARLREYLTGPAMTDLDHMVEVQVRGVRPADIAATRVEPGAVGARPVGI
jgi:hypothetical protein